jgi:GNAT superfamily N-acetyltransferase
MNIRIAGINADTFADLLCRCCIYWEHNEQFRKVTDEEAEKMKREWFEATSAIIGPCGKLLYVDDVPAAYCQYAPPAYLPCIRGYDTLASQADPNAIFISCLTVREEYRNQGVGTRLLREVIKECLERGHKAVETIARDDSDDNCSGPTRLYQKQGFTLVATWVPGAKLSLMRLELSK